jgi:uncharacterized protein (TIGR03435 family)
MTLKKLTALLLCTCASLLAQTSATTPASKSDSAKQLKFDVASIKLNPDCDTRRGLSSPPSPDNFRMVCATLRQLITSAYGTFEGSNYRFPRLEVVGGPHWVDTDRYDVNAKTEGSAPQWQKAGRMLQALLEDRFQVKVHTEPRDTPAFVMTVVKSGSGLKSVTEGSCIAQNLDDPRATPAPGSTANQPTVSTPAGPRPKYCGMGGFANKGLDTIADIYGVTIAQFAASTLSSRVGRIVVDKTGLTGLFDIHLEFSREFPAPAIDTSGAPESAPPAASPAIMQALEQQLGVKLTSTRAPIDVIVIDRAEKPAEN